MGRKKSWFRAVKKAFSPESKKSTNFYLERYKQSDPCPSEIRQSIVSDVAPPSPPAHHVPHPEEGKFVEVEAEESKHAYSVAVASEAAAQVVQVTSLAKFAGKSREEVAAIKIQTAFRGYLARRALRALRGLVRLKSLMRGNAVKGQATTTLRFMQTLARVQSQIRSRRIQILEENQALQRQLLLKRERELENLKMSGEWDDSTQSKEQIEVGLLRKQQATIRRERALAYAFSHQWKNSSKLVYSTFIDSNNPQWGWSWLERWMAARPWESKGIIADMELNQDPATLKNSNVGEILKSYARWDTSLDGSVAATPQKSTRLASRQSPVIPRSKLFSGTGKAKSASPKNGWAASDDDAGSMISGTSERSRRHSVAGSSIRNAESLANSAGILSYMAPTQSARAKNCSSSPLSDVKIETTPGKGSAGTVKKKLSFPNSPSGMRRHSGPPRVDVSVALKEVAVSQQNGANAESS